MSMTPSRPGRPAAVAALTIVALSLSSATASAQSADEMIDREEATPTQAAPGAQAVSERELRDPNWVEYTDGKLIRVIQKGFHARGESGPLVYLPPVTAFTDVGSYLRAGLGYEIHPDYFALDVNFLAFGAPGLNRRNVFDEGPDLKAKVRGGHVSLGGELLARIHVPIAQRWRFVFTLGGGALWSNGYVKGYKEVDPNDPEARTPIAGKSLDFFASGGVGVEYFMKMRGFSTGINAGGMYLIQNGIPAFMVAPFIKYTFDLDDPVRSTIAPAAPAGNGG